MSMEPIMGGLFLINGTDIWTEYGVFLTEEKRGGRDNLKAILAASKTKAHTAVDIREENGEKYSDILTVANEARDITLTFALYAPGKGEWLKKYMSFISFLKTGDKGWLSLYFPRALPGLSRLHPADLPLAGRRAGRPLQGEIPRTRTNHLNNVQTPFEHAFNGI